MNDELLATIEISEESLEQLQREGIIQLENGLPTRESERLFVYGTLKKGYGLHHAIERCKFLGAGAAEGHALLDFGPYPAMYPDFTHDVKGEVYEVDDTVLKHTDIIEGVKGGLYRRGRVFVRGHGYCETYLRDRPREIFKRIVDGVWRGSGQNKTEEVNPNVIAPYYQGGYTSYKPPIDVGVDAGHVVFGAPEKLLSVEEETQLLQENGL